MSESTRHIAVVGQGIVGLTCAARLLERGYVLTIFSRESFQDTTSMSAGAYWWPHKAYPAAKVSRWAKETYEEYTHLRALPGSGIRFVNHYRFCVEPDDCVYARDLVKKWEVVDGSSHGITCHEAFLLTVPTVDVPVFMPYLRNQLLSKGVTFRVKTLRSPGELFSDHDMVINCTGVGARHFVGDKGVFPIRGQVIRVSSQPSLSESLRVVDKGELFTLILPRSRDVILGGTAQVGDWSRSPRAEDTTVILRRCAALAPVISRSKILGVQVGLRPGRSQVRLEMELIARGKPVIHNYGHGGSGYTVAWGCASEVADLADEFFSR